MSETTKTKTLRDYVVHAASCAKWPLYGGPIREGYPCTCGLDALLAAPVEGAGETGETIENYRGLWVDVLAQLRQAEARERRLREALEAIYAATRDDAKGEWWTIRAWMDRRGLFHDDLGDHRVIAEVCRAALEGKGE